MTELGSVEVEAFRRSLNKLAQNIDEICNSKDWIFPGEESILEEFFEPIRSAIKDRKFGGLNADLVTIALGPLVSSLLREALRIINYCMLNGWGCESPIENKLFLAIVSIAQHVCFYDQVVIAHHKKDSEDWVFHRLYTERFPYSELRIFLQYPVSNFRADFLLECHKYTYDVNTYRNDPPAMMETSHKVTDRLIIECDGHDFHEKTKEQAKRDKERDREFQKLGYRVFHYTGSEVWNDTYKCAVEVLNTLGVTPIDDSVAVYK